MSPSCKSVETAGAKYLMDFVQEVFLSWRNVSMAQAAQVVNQCSLFYLWAWFPRWTLLTRFTAIALKKRKYRILKTNVTFFTFNEMCKWSFRKVFIKTAGKVKCTKSTKMFNVVQALHKQRAWALQNSVITFFAMRNTLFYFLIKGKRYTEQGVSYLQRRENISS